MKLAKLIGDLVELDARLAEIEVGGVEEDSRMVRQGDLFVAIPGLTVDGHDFVGAAVAAGAVAVACSKDVACAVPRLLYPDPARLLAVATARLAGQPARHLELIGITGTNGKTTTSYLIEAILVAAGRRPGVIGTVSYRFAGQEEQAPFTTPTPGALHGLLARMVASGCSHAVLEVSSHALALGRVHGLEVAVAGFSNLTQDHLDLHGSMEAYLEAKLMLFRQHLRRSGTAVVNVDASGAEHVVAAVRERSDLNLLRCSTAGAPAEASLLGLRSSVDGITATLDIAGEQVALRSPLLGAYNADNILMAAACSHAAGIPLDGVAAGIATLRGVPGRLERVDCCGQMAVLVDYAHTPDALVRAISVLRPLCADRLIVVFGCGGDRDRSKRPLMGRAVAREADLAVVTSDNPRTEDPQDIIAAILDGVRQEQIAELTALDAGRGYLVQPDRRRAIFAAVQAARAGDIVLIAGKGHEDYQILGRTRIHFDDREQAREAMAGGPP